jgi:hypothetical protein
MSPPRSPSADQLQQIYELNRLFLTFLQSAKRERLDSLEFPAVARGVLRAASRAQLDTIGEFPRALFRISLDDDSTETVDPLHDASDALRHSLHLSILLYARTFSRQSIYQARFLFGLESRAIARLRSLQLPDLQRFAARSRLVTCAFATRGWLWVELFTETRPEGRRQLALIALQPGLEEDWPARRLSQIT